MALQRLLNSSGIPLWPLPGWPAKNLTAMQNFAAIDAVGESVAYIGEVWLSGGPGTSKTFGGGATRLAWSTGTATTWANTASILRVGIQGVNTTTGLEDGTWLAYADLVPGTNTVINNAVALTPILTGSVTLTHGDLIAVVIEWIARAGADSVRPAQWGVSSAFPYCTSDVGAGPVKSAIMPATAFQLSDGTWGSLGEFTVPLVSVTSAITSATNPDEMALGFQLPFRCAVNAVIAMFGEVDPGENGRFSLYQDPASSDPIPLASVEPPSGAIGQVGSTSSMGLFQIPETVLEPNTPYAVAYAALTTGSRQVSKYQFASPTMRELLCFGAIIEFYDGNRQNFTGPFTGSNTAFPCLGVMISKLDDGGGGSAGVASPIFGGSVL